MFVVVQSNNCFALHFFLFFFMELEKILKQKKFRNQYHKATLNIIYTSNWLNDQHESVFKKHNLTVQQFNVLRILRGQFPNPSTVGLIKERMLDKMSDASRIVERLRQKDLIERRICQNDRRAVEILISQKGLDLLKELDNYEDVFDKYLTNLNSSQIKELNLLLDKIRE